MTQSPPHPHQHHGPESSAAEDARVRLLDLISSGALRPGDRLGTERELAARLSVSRSTLRQVLAVLAQAGTVRRVPGRTGGTFVAHTKVDRDLSVIVGLPEYLRRQGFVRGHPGAVRHDRAWPASRPPPSSALPPGALVLDITRIRLADSHPDLAGARPAARRDLPRPAGAAARRVDLRAARGPVRDPAGRRGRAPGGGRGHRRRGQPARGQRRAPRCSPSPGRPARRRGCRSSSPRTCSGPTAPG